MRVNPGKSINRWLFKAKQGGVEMTAEPNESTCFEALQAQGQRAFEAGELEESIAILHRAYEWAEENGDSRQADLAFCNLTSARISRGEVDLLEPQMASRLREILVANTDLSNSRLAAYNLARAFEYRKDNKKGLFYARIALDRAEQLGRADWIASSHHQIGNFLLAESFFEEAQREYESALSIFSKAATAGWSLSCLNLGYCKVIQGRVLPGLKLLFQSLRFLRRAGLAQDLAVNHADLCYAYLELGRYRHAIRHGVKALAIAEDRQSGELTKNALFLLGTALRRARDPKAAFYFKRLQDEHYPSYSFATELLLNVDVRSMINLRAS